MAHYTVGWGLIISLMVDISDFINNFALIWLQILQKHMVHWLDDLWHIVKLDNSQKISLIMESFFEVYYQVLSINYFSLANLM